MAVVTDPVERAARIMAAILDQNVPWSEMTQRWQDEYREAARAVVNDLAHAGQPAPRVDAAYEAVRIDPTTDRDRWDIFDDYATLEAPGEDEL